MDIEDEFHSYFSLHSSVVMQDELVHFSSVASNGEALFLFISPFSG
jgi:hypothetical protein